MPRFRRRTGTPPREQRGVKLLLDENLSYRLAAQLETGFPGTRHVDAVGLGAKSDARIWEYAGDNGFTVVSKDDDFRQLSFLHGAPPKVVWLEVANASTQKILRLLNARRPAIEAFARDDEEALLILKLPRGPRR
jgi:predicted nuclease of predicted toxin-antitoxin system